MPTQTIEWPKKARELKEELTDSTRFSPASRRRLIAVSSKPTCRSTRSVSGPRSSTYLTADDIRKYEESVAKNLSPECAHWLATGAPAGEA
jgi:hypothetical protein